MVCGRSECFGRALAVLLFSVSIFAQWLVAFGHTEECQMLPHITLPNVHTHRILQWTLNVLLRIVVQLDNFLVTVKLPHFQVFFIHFAKNV